MMTITLLLTMMTGVEDENDFDSSDDNDDSSAATGDNVMLSVHYDSKILV